MVKITLCWGSWFLLYSMLKYGAKRRRRRRKAHFCLGGGGGGIKTTAANRQQSGFLNIARSHAQSSIFGTYLRTESSQAVPWRFRWKTTLRRRKQIIRSNRRKNGSYKSLFDWQIETYITVELWHTFCGRESARLAVKGGREGLISTFAHFDSPCTQKHTKNTNYVQKNKNKKINYLRKAKVLKQNNKRGLSVVYRSPAVSRAAVRERSPHTTVSGTVHSAVCITLTMTCGQTKKNCRLFFWHF